MLISDNRNDETAFCAGINKCRNSEKTKNKYDEIGNCYEEILAGKIVMAVNGVAA